MGLTPFFQDQAEAEDGILCLFQTMVQVGTFLAVAAHQEEEGAEP